MEPFFSRASQVERPLIDRERGFLEAFRKSRMGVTGSRDILGARAKFDHGDRFAMPALHLLLMLSLGLSLFYSQISFPLSLLSLRVFFAIDKLKRLMIHLQLPKKLLNFPYNLFDFVAGQ